MALQQQVFALDAKFNAHRSPNSPNFRTLYIRRRSQLLRDSNRSVENWKQYLKTRLLLLQHRYCVMSDINTISFQNYSKIVNQINTNVNLPCNPNVVPTKQAEASRAIVGDNSVAENYAFIGVHYIFDQHTNAITMVKFANNDRSKLCCCSMDGNLSICSVDNNPSVLSVLRGHTAAVMGFDWSVNNDIIVSASLDGTIKVWSMNDYKCLRSINNLSGIQQMCCLFQPFNNNLLVVGNNRGAVCVANVSTGLFMKNTCRVGGIILSLVFDTSGKNLWIGNNKGEIVSMSCDMGGNLSQIRRLRINSSYSITSLSYKAWINREARDPSLLVNCTDNSVYLFRVLDSDGGLQLKRKFKNKHEHYSIKSIFCPIMSFRQGACIVTGSEDGAVYFLNIEKPVNRSCVNTLQGHASPVLGVSFNYDESLLATGDLEGLIIVWKRTIL